MIHSIIIRTPQFSGLLIDSHSQILECLDIKGNVIKIVKHPSMSDGELEELFKTIERTFNE